MIFHSSIRCMYKKMYINITFFSAKKDNIKCCIPQWWNYLYRLNCDNETYCVLLTLFYIILKLIYQFSISFRYFHFFCLLKNRHKILLHEKLTLFRKNDEWKWRVFPEIDKRWIVLFWSLLNKITVSWWGIPSCLETKTSSLYVYSPILMWHSQNLYTSL